MGVLLALLLGVAAGAFVLAVPIRMLETITTFSGLSRLMVQAEPPISPNDRMLLAVLAGVFSSGLGWVLVDLLLFGRAGMKQLIRSEDEYEEEDEYSFRPTDPLDLVSPVSAPPGEWSMPMAGDTRKPLSALTDIGDPPAAIPQPFPSSFNDSPPPLDRILPGVGTSAPPLAPNAPSAPPPLIATEPPPLIVPSLSQPASGGIWGDAAASMPPPPVAPAWDLPAPAAPAPRVEPAAPVIAAGGWMPTPGARAPVDAPDDEIVAADGASDAFPIPAPPPLIEPAAWPDPSIAAQQSFSIQDALAALSPEFPPPPAPAVHLSEPPAPPPLMPEPFAPAPMPVVPEPVAPAPVAVEPVAPAAPPEWPAAQPAPARRVGTPGLAGFDKAKLEDMLERLERGLQRRREAAAVAAPVAPPLPPVAAPPPPAFEAAPSPIERQPLPAAYSAPAFVAPPPEPFAPQPLAYEPPAPVEPAPPPLVPTQPVVSGENEALLSQPLHMTLEVLRNRVKR